MKGGKFTDMRRWTSTPEQTVVKEEIQMEIKYLEMQAWVETQQTESYGSQHRLCSKRDGSTTNEIKKKRF